MGDLPETLQREIRSLSQKLENLEVENRTLKQKLTQYEEDQGRFLNLMVASQRLSEARDVRGILDNINEIIINLIGSEQFGLFFVKDSSDQPLELVCEVFEEGGHLETPPNLEQQKIRECLETGKIQMYSSTKGTPSAIIPLRMNDSALGALVLYSVLPHKGSFTKTDHDLFELLAHSAARAFYACLMQSVQGMPKDLPNLLKTTLCSDIRFQ